MATRKDNDGQEPGTEVAQANGGGEVARTPSGLLVPSERVQQALQFKSYLKQRAADGRDSRAFEVSAGQMTKILAQTDFDAIMDADMDDTFETRDLIDFEMKVLPGISVVDSDERFESPLEVYVQFEAIALIDVPGRNVKVGDILIISSGASLVITKLRTLEANGHLPADVKIVGTPAPNGVVIKLGKLPKRAVSATVTA